MKIQISDIILKMIDESKGNLHDINHFLKVYAYAQVIGEKELADEEARNVLEVAALLHDIACPLCREKYGNANGKLQEQEGMPLTEAFLAEFFLPQKFVDRVVYLVGHHHTLTDVTWPEHQILLEADYLVNADEGGCTKEQIALAMESFFRTATGVALLKSMYLRAK